MRLAGPVAGRAYAASAERFVLPLDDAGAAWRVSMPIRASSASTKPRDGHTFTLDLEPSDKLTDLSVREAGKRAHLLSELFRQAGAGRTRPMSLARIGWLRPAPRSRR